MVTSRKRKSESARVETPGGFVRISTFGKEGENGWDVWVPATVSLHKISRGTTGTLIRLVPDGASR